MTHKHDRTLAARGLARVEGEGGLYVRVHGDRVDEVQLDIYEPPRFFEAFLRGRAYSEPPDITARICGICPVAYQMSACQAIEDAVEIRPRIVEGNAAAALLAASPGAELLVVGSRGHGGFAEALLGSASQHCVYHAPCPVVIIRDPNR